MAYWTTGDVLTAIKLNEHLRVTTGTYTGDGTANRAIPHSLGVIPHFVLIYKTDVNITHAIIYQTHGYIHNLNTVLKYAITASDSTNFYVGNNPSYAAACNGADLPYSWLAIGSS